MNCRPLAAVVALGLVAAACSTSDESGPETSPSATVTASASTSSSSTSSSTTSTTSTSTTTSTTIAATTTTTTEPDPAIDALVMSGDGIGTAGFGAEPEGVVNYVSLFLGEPSNDTGWIDPLTIGACPGTELRLVSWGVLTLVFGDSSDVLQDRRHFFAYAYGVEGEIGADPEGLMTTRGVTIGSRVQELVAAYPSVTLNPEDDFGAPFFYVNENLRGLLTGTEDEATVTAIFGGVSCTN